MKLTDGEKLIAFMLADVMERLAIEGDIDPDFVKTVISGDDGWALQWKYPSLFHNEGPSEEVVSETASIMSMCRVLENSIANLDDDDRSQIPEHDQKVFEGFDGNEEPHFGVANMLIQQLDRFSEWQDRPLNSHSSTLRRYRAMLRAYEHMDLPMSGGFSLNDIQTILIAPSLAR